MSLFDETVAYYRQHRPGIPAQVAAALDAAAPARQPRRLLDIATGTGLVAQALLGKFDDIIAIDNDPGMLAAAEQTLRPALLDGITLVLAESTAGDYTPPGWKADLVTICRAFHWLDQASTLARLDSQVAPDGAVAIFGDSSLWNAGAGWARAVRGVVQDFLGEQRRAGGGTFQHHNRPYSEIMREPPFSEVEECTVPVRRTWTADAVIGYLYSTSFAAPALFGDRLAEFDAAARAVLARHGDDGQLTEDNEFLIRIGRRNTP